MIDHVDERIFRPGRGCGLLFFLLMLAGGALYGAALGLFVQVLEDSKTTITALEDFRPKEGSKIYSDDGELLGEFTTEARQLIRLSDMPLRLQKAFIATEDDKFYEHKGVRIDAIVNALISSIRTGNTRGGSTITQQVVRNIEPLAVGQERSITRKLREAIVALQVERQFTKDEILELYLNQIFLGISAHGVESAAWQYFGCSSRDLSLGESAMLAGLTRSPNRQEPFNNFQNALVRRNIVLDQMLENGFITAEECAAAKSEDLADQILTPAERAELRRRGQGVWSPNRFAAPYFAEEVRRFLLDEMGKEQVFEEGFEVQTTVDMRMQRAAEEALFTALDKFDADRRAALERAGRLEDFVPVSGALVCLDNRQGFKGFVRAMVGGRDFQEEKYNTATQAKRQPGSSIKPFVWAAAIANGMTPATIVVDEPITRSSGTGIWAPKNFDGKFGGSRTLRESLEKSVNIVSIKLVEKFGMPSVRSILQDAGIRTPISDGVGVTIALGTPEITVLDHCTAYATFANLGVHYDPVMVKEIKNRDGLTQYTYRQTQRSRRALDPAVAYVVSYMMEGVAQWGTGARSSALDRPRAGKTGTTNESRDVWFCGYTPDFTCVVWIGYRDNRPLGRGANYTGGRLACPVWTDFMVKIHEGLPKQDFEVPPGVEFHNINKNSGYAGGSFREAFIAGTGPRSAPAPKPAKPAAAPAGGGESGGGGLEPLI